MVAHKKNDSDTSDTEDDIHDSSKAGEETYNDLEAPDTEGNEMNKVTPVHNIDGKDIENLTDEEVKDAEEWFQNNETTKATYDEDMDDIKWKLSEPRYTISIGSVQWLNSSIIQ